MIDQITQHENTRWYFDSIHKIGDEYKLNGWIYNTQSDITDYYLDGEKLSVVRSNRPDVNNFFSIQDNPSKLGISFRISTNLKESILSIEVNGEIIVLGSILKWIVYYSKFNRDHKDLIVVDNFYENPDLIRSFAMNSLGFKPSDYHKGQRSIEKFYLHDTKEMFEKIIGRRIINWDNPNYANGVFQFTTAQDSIVYHVDTQTYAAMVFLTPDAPLETGTAFYKSKFTGATIFDGTHDQEEFNKTFKGISSDLNFYDSTQYELMDEVANVYNRLVLFNAKRIHAATKYFGDAIENARFFQLFFFDVE
jgi:Family of unknown function (DUF6445)